MIGLLIDGVFGAVFRSFLSGPMMICGLVATVAALFGCVKCAKCRLRDCECCKRLLRFTGHDEFDDFELMVLVHEAIFDMTDRGSKMKTVVRVTAGGHAVRTDPNSNGVFQQPLHILVEQGAETIQVDLMDGHDRVLASLPLDTMEEILNLSDSAHLKERSYRMHQKGKGVKNPKIKLTMSVHQDNDVEEGLLNGEPIDADLNDLVRLQLTKARSEGKGTSEMEVLKQACSGPLELFVGLGHHDQVYVSILGPPDSRHWILGIWQNKNDFLAKKSAHSEVDLLRIQSVQADPTRHHVFVINYYDSSRVFQAITLRRTDRARDVWVEILHLMVQKVRDHRAEGARKTHGGAGHHQH